MVYGSLVRSGMLSGIVTRKNLMTFTLDDSSRELKVQAMLRGWICRNRLRRGCDPHTGVKLPAEKAKDLMKVVKNLRNDAHAAQAHDTGMQPRP